MANAAEMNCHRQNHLHTIPMADLKCHSCDLEFRSENKFELHIKYDHRSTADSMGEAIWTCEDCSYQTNDPKGFCNHLKQLNSHKPTVTMPKEMKICHTCGNVFPNFRILMEHRKENHPSNRKCRNLPNCHYGNECYYVHPEEMEVDGMEATQKATDTVFKCHVCGKVFSLKRNMMDHRKREHPSQIPCRDYLNNQCRRGQQCWYRHGEQAAPLPQPQATTPMDLSPSPPEPAPVTAPAPGHWVLPLGQLLRP